jgi:hypothetical protein
MRRKIVMPLIYALLFLLCERFAPRPSESQQAGATASLQASLHHEGENQSMPVIATFFDQI